MRFRKTLAVVCVASSLSACESFEIGVYDTLGAGVGAVAGGFLGYQFGGGTGQLLMAGLGAVVGGVGGWFAGGLLEGDDQASLDRTTEKALAMAQDGQTMGWSNPETKVSGRITPVYTYVDDQGRYCRSLHGAITIDETVHRRNGTACRDSSGAWAEMTVTMG